MPRVSRRRALTHIGAAGAGALLVPSVVWGRQGDIVINGAPMEFEIGDAPGGVYIRARRLGTTGATSPTWVEIGRAHV